MNKIKGRLGLGCMRLPINLDESINYEEMSKMVDYFINNGFNYFDTARIYHNGNSEIALRETLVIRYPRDKFLIADKLYNTTFTDNKSIRELFFSQLNSLGVDYVDFYLMHAQSKKNYSHFQESKAYEEAFKLKEEGYIRHVGISFHDSPEFLEKILNDHPNIEFVQLQLNYVDYGLPLESGRCYEICKERNIPVVVMEPLRGGDLARLPFSAEQYSNKIGGSQASIALRYLLSLDNVMMILSGMNKLEDVIDNCKTVNNFVPLNNNDLSLLDKIIDELHKKVIIPCTGCRYCYETCPKHIDIPEIFRIYNKDKSYALANGFLKYRDAIEGRSKAGDCVGCGKCEEMCPQKIDIRNYLKRISKEYD